MECQSLENKANESTCMLRDSSVQTVFTDGLENVCLLGQRKSSVDSGSSKSLCKARSSSSDQINENLIGYDVMELRPGISQNSSGCDKISICKWKSLDSVSACLNINNSSTRNKDHASRRNSIISSRLSKSVSSLESQEESGPSYFVPVHENENICHVTCSFEKQRKHSKEDKCWCLHGSSLTCSFWCVAWLGLLLVLVGCLLPVGFWSFRRITESVKHVESQLPSYVSGTTMTLCGVLTIIASFKRHKILIALILVLSFVCTIFCTSSLVYLVSEVNSRLAQLEDCSFNSYDKICSCYVRSGQTKKLFRFAEVMNCRSVKENLRELVYGVSALFAVGCVISVGTAISSVYLLCKERNGQTQEQSPASATATTSTTQTQESSFTSPVSWQVKDIKATLNTRRTEDRSVQGVNNFSVATQTPLFMMPVPDLMRGILSRNSDYEFDLLIDGCEPPPSYHDAVASLRS